VKQIQPTGHITAEMKHKIIPSSEGNTPQHRGRKKALKSPDFKALL